MINQGSVFEGFRLLRPLGQGWLGEVYAAQDLDAGTTGALRVLAPEHLAQPQLLAQFARLFDKVRRLRHGGILELGQYVESEGRAFYTMTLAQSGSVRALLQGAAREGQYLDLLVALDLVRQAAAALDFAHKADLMHGNLKPENLLLQGARALMGRTAYAVQLSDFGVGELRAFTYGTHDRLIVTTPAYMAPEQCRGVRGERRSDVYALGVILYELLTNLVPFETRDLADALEKHQHVAPIPPGQIRRDLPEDLEEVVLTCLAKAPEYRYPTAGDLEAALQAVMNRLMPQGPNPTVVLPDLPERTAPAYEAPGDRASDPRLLILNEGGQVLRTEALVEQTTTLGRAARNTVVLEHPGVSRHHLNLELEGDKVFVTDLSSTNGSALDRLKLPPMKRVPWAYGSVLHLGPYWLALVAPFKAPPQARIGVSTESATLELTPGVARALRVQLANTGKTVDHFMIGVEGVPPEWVHNAFHEVQLNPGTRGETTLHLLVPRTTSAQANDYPVRVTARSRENPQEVGFAPMTWTVLPFAETTLEVTPQKRRAWRRTRYELSIKNGGNTPITYSSAVADDEGGVKLDSPLGMLRVPRGGDLTRAVPVGAMVGRWTRQVGEGLGKVRVAPLAQNVRLAPGEVHRESVHVRLPIRWVGVARSRQLQVGVRGEAERGEADKIAPARVGLQQNPIVPLWTVPVALALGALAFFWLTRPPTIVDVTVSPPNPPAGQPFTVGWETRNARAVKLQPFGGELPVGPAGKGSFTVNGGVADVTELKLTAYSRFKDAQRAVTVTPKLPAPSIVRFDVTPLNVAAGGTVTVRWNVQNVKNVTLEPFGTLEARGEVKRKVSADTAFRLSATSGGESVTRNVDVKVLAPVVELFKVSPEDAEAGQTVTIRWKVANATSVSIDPIGTVGPSGEKKVIAQQNTTYRITAGNGLTTVSSAGAVNVVARPPKVLAFSVSPASVRVGENYTVTWQTQDASGVEVSGPNGTQTLPPGGSVVQVAPASPAPVTLTLTARGPGGQQDARSASVVVEAKSELPPAPPVVAKLPTPAPTPKPAAPPTIKLFTASAREVTKGGKVTLKWQVGGVRQITLQPLNKTFPAQGSLEVAVAQDTTYTLSASGVSAQQSVKVRAPAPKPAPAHPPLVAKTPAPVPAIPVAQAAPASIVSFTASSDSVPRGGNVTLSWNVQNAKSVTISNLGEVGGEGSREATIDRATVFLLRAQGEDGKSVTQTLRVNTESAAKTPSLPGSSALSGTWLHSFGKLTLQIDGSNVTGSFSNERNGDQGQVRGKLIRGGSSAFTLNAQVTLPSKPDENIAFVVSFNEGLTAFYGPYSSRAARERWCGWRPGTPPPAECFPN